MARVAGALLVAFGARPAESLHLGPAAAQSPVWSRLSETTRMRTLGCDRLAPRALITVLSSESDKDSETNRHSMICPMADQLRTLRRQPSCRLVALIVLDFDRRRRRVISCSGYSEHCDLKEYRYYSSILCQWLRMKEITMGSTVNARASSNRDGKVTVISGRLRPVPATGSASRAGPGWFTGRRT
jgi:hypothetical protein